MVQASTQTIEMTARAEKKRVQILEGARVVFLAEGFDGASMEAIAQAAGVSKGTLYTYFKGKDELFTALVAACQNRSLEETFRSLNGTADLRESLEALACNYLDLVRQPDNLALLRAVVGAAAKFPSLGRASGRAPGAVPQGERSSERGRHMGCRARSGAVLRVSPGQRCDPNAHRSRTISIPAEVFGDYRASRQHAAA
jgi:AcrR family transcriptional regulator